MSAIERAVDTFGSQAALARALGVTTQAVNQWVWGKRQIPLDRARDIERASAGQVTARELRPDLAAVFGTPAVTEHGTS